MIETTEAIIVYDALTTHFDVQLQGGSLTQRYNSLTQEYVPNRTLFPVALIPKLTVIDPNENNKVSDQTSMITVEWYGVSIGSGGAETETRLPSTSYPGYTISGNVLTVGANVPAGSNVILRAKASYINPHTNDRLLFNRDFSLTTTTYQEYNCALEVNAPVLLTTSAFKLTEANRYRTVTARFLAGKTDISTNANMVYVWEKMINNQYVQITVPTVTSTEVNNDQFGEVQSINGRQMVLDLFCIQREKYRCTAYYNVAPYNQPQFRMQRLFTVDRQMPGYTLKPRVSLGKYLRKSSQMSVCDAVLTINSNEVSNPSQWFVIWWTFYRQSSTSQQNVTSLGTGNSASVNRSLSGYDRSKIPTFKMEYKPLTEYRVVHDKDQNNHEYVVVDDTTGAVVIMQATPDDPKQ